MYIKMSKCIPCMIAIRHAFVFAALHAYFQETRYFKELKCSLQVIMYLKRKFTTVQIGQALKI